MLGLRPDALLRTAVAAQIFEKFMAALYTYIHYTVLEPLRGVQARSDYLLSLLS